MHGKNIFTIPIYQRDFNDHSNLMFDNKRKYINEVSSKNKHLTSELLEEQFHNNMFYPWKYSQIIGYVEINIEFNDLKAYYWYVKAKNVTYKLKNRAMEEKGKLSDVSKITYKNDKICKDIRNFIKILPKLRRKFKNKYFDTSNIEMILESIDFEKIDVKAE